MTKLSIALLLFLLASVRAYNPYNEQDCAAGQKLAVLDILLDPDPQETGWSLACDHDDGQMIWQVPKGSFSSANVGEWITESSCINDTTTCSFNITDSGRDGLIGDGFYTLLLGATTVGVSEYGKGVPFTERSYCFGPGCAAPPLERAEDEAANPFHHEENCGILQEQAVLDIILDSKAHEIGWSLVCNGETIWNIPTGMFSDANVGEWITESSCINDTTTCSFNITDSGRDGLIGDGFYTLLLGATTVGVSEYGKGVPFTERSYCLGPGCAAPPLERAEDEAANPFHHEENCGILQEQAVLDIILDSKAHQIGWSLVCNGETIWNISIGMLRDPEGTWISESSCIDETVTCNFTIFDAGGDGFIDDGLYDLKFGATTVAVSEYGMSDAFTDRSFCFGQGDCATASTVASEPPLEIVEEEATYPYHKDENCTQGQGKAVFEILLDFNSLETGWGLMCDGQTVWDIPTGSLNEPEGTRIIEISCINETATCEFIILDKGGDGLVGEGFFLLSHELSKWGMSAPFTEKSYCFGQECPERPLEQAEEDGEQQQEDQEGEPTEQDHNTTMGSNAVQDKKSNVSKTKSKTGLIIGVTVGVACFILVLVLLNLVVQKKKQTDTASVASEKDDATRASSNNNKAASDNHVSEQ
jgi:hypothetical protein